jgi:hypothetical protein
LAARLADVRQQVLSLRCQLGPGAGGVELDALLAARGGIRKSRRQRGQEAELEGLSEEEEGGPGGCGWCRSGEGGGGAGPAARW